MDIFEKKTNRSDKVSNIPFPEALFFGPKPFGYLGHKFGRLNIPSKSHGQFEKKLKNLNFKFED